MTDVTKVCRPSYSETSSPAVYRGSSKASEVALGLHAQFQHINFSHFSSVECMYTDSLVQMHLHLCLCRDFTPAVMILQVTVGDDTLTQVVQVANSKTSDKPLKFTTALHTYFRVSSISQTHVEGLSGLKYLDNMQSRHEVCCQSVSPVQC